jgi:TRAP-type C4-dicarboxylate transport system permease small subunit
MIMMAMLRAGVSAYLIYLGYSLIRDQLDGSSTLAPWLSWASGVFFVLAGLCFLFYAWKRYRAETKQRPAEDGAEDAPEDMPEDKTERSEGKKDENRPEE